MAPDDPRREHSRPDGPVPEAVPAKLSEILLTIAQQPDSERISIGDLLAALQHRAIGALLFIFAVPNVIPVPPGVSAILGAPLIFLAMQLMLGRRSWLPRIITDRSLARVDFAKVVTKAAPWLARAERLMKPRLQFLVYPPAEYVIGAICLLMAIILFLPIPLGNMLPAFTICVFALAVLERDGLWAILGALCALAAVIVVWGVFFAVIRSVIFVLGRLLGA